MTDLKAHLEISNNFPSCPSFMQVSIDSGARRYSFRVEKDGTLSGLDDSNSRGTWWGMSATCLCLDILEKKIFFRYSGSGDWESNNYRSTIHWTKKRVLDNGNSKIVEKTPIRSKCVSPGSATPNLSRFRMSVLPIHKLDYLHRDQLECMGFRLCFHADVGRVLVSTKKFDDGDIIIYSKVQAIDVDTDQDVIDILDPSHPSCCYLLVPRRKKLYYNRGTFSDEDPVASGDLWYLVNHSARPNCEVQLRAHGIQLKAKHTIQPYEPITWTYPFGFFAKDEVAVDLPRNVLPEDSIFIRE